MKKTFKTYAEAYELYSSILSGREPDRKNPTIFMNQNSHICHGGGGALGGAGSVLVEWHPYVVEWEAK